MNNHTTASPHIIQSVHASAMRCRLDPLPHHTVVSRPHIRNCAILPMHAGVRQPRRIFCCEEVCDGVAAVAGARAVSNQYSLWTYACMCNDCIQYISFTKMPRDVRDETTERVNHGCGDIQHSTINLRCLAPHKPSFELYGNTPLKSRCVMYVAGRMHACSHCTCTCTSLDVFGQHRYAIP